MIGPSTTVSTVANSMSQLSINTCNEQVTLVFLSNILSAVKSNSKVIPSKIDEIVEYLLKTTIHITPIELMCTLSTLMILCQQTGHFENYFAILLVLSTKIYDDFLSTSSANNVYDMYSIVLELKKTLQESSNLRSKCDAIISLCKNPQKKPCAPPTELCALFNSKHKQNPLHRWYTLCYWMHVVFPEELCQKQQEKLIMAVSHIHDRHIHDTAGCPRHILYIKLCNLLSIVCSFQSAVAAGASSEKTPSLLNKFSFSFFRSASPTSSKPTATSLTSPSTSPRARGLSISDMQGQAMTHTTSNSSLNLSVTSSSSRTRSLSVTETSNLPLLSPPRSSPLLSPPRSSPLLSSPRSSPFLSPPRSPRTLSDNYANAVVHISSQGLQATVTAGIVSSGVESDVLSVSVYPHDVFSWGATSQAIEFLITILRKMVDNKNISDEFIISILKYTPNSALLSRSSIGYQKSWLQDVQPDYREIFYQCLCTHFRIPDPIQRIEYFRTIASLPIEDVTRKLPVLKQILNSLCQTPIQIMSQKREITILEIFSACITLYHSHPDQQHEFVQSYQDVVDAVLRLTWEIQLHAIAERNVVEFLKNIVEYIEFFKDYICDVSITSYKKTALQNTLSALLTGMRNLHSTTITQQDLLAKKTMILNICKELENKYSNILEQGPQSLILEIRKF